jgi:DNA-binding NarL/FixJ family response regulator
MQKITLLVAERHRLVRDSLRHSLEHESDLKILGDASDGPELLRVARQKPADLLLFNAAMPNLDLKTVIAELNGACRAMRYLAITGEENEERLSSLVSLGIQGFILPDSNFFELLCAIRTVARGDRYVDPKLKNTFGDAVNPRRDEMTLLLELTPKEKEVLYWVSQGFCNADIANMMVLSEKTVKNHISHLLKKLDVKDRTQAAVLAWKLGLPQEGPDRFGQY